MSVAIKFNLSELGKLQASLNKLQNKVNPCKALMMGLAATLRATTQDHFSTKQTPNGKDWTSGLVQSGDLRKKLEIDADDSTAMVGSNLEYAAIHQAGGVIKPKKAKVLSFIIDGERVFARKVTIKANPYLGISSSDEKALLDTVKDFFEEGLKA